MGHSKPDKPKATQQTPNSNQNTYGDKKIPESNIENVNGQKNQQQSYNLGHTTRYERLNLIVLAGIFIVTAIYAYFSYGQWNIMGNSMELDQRAWIGITHISQVGEIGKPTSVTINIINTGKTPARNVVSAGILETMKGNSPPNFALEKYILRESKGIIAPHQPGVLVHNITKQPPFSDAEMLGLISGKVRLYAHGIVEYDDIFGHHHWITYCYCLSADGKIFYHCKEHNDTDDK